MGKKGNKLEEGNVMMKPLCYMLLLKIGSFFKRWESRKKRTPNNPFFKPRHYRLRTIVVDSAVSRRAEKGGVGRQGQRAEFPEQGCPTTAVSDGQNLKFRYLLQLSKDRDRPSQVLTPGEASSYLLSCTDLELEPGHPKKGRWHRGKGTLLSSKQK